MEVKINAIQFIIETIDNKLRENPPLKKAVYLTERKEVNLKKLESCHELIEISKKYVL
jgi:hypothetical protein